MMDGENEIERRKFIDAAAIALWSTADDRTHKTAVFCFTWAEELWLTRQQIIEQEIGDSLNQEPANAAQKGG